MTATVFPDMFDAAAGVQYAIADAKTKARQALFETVTYQMRSERVQTAGE